MLEDVPGSRADEAPEGKENVKDTVQSDASNVQVQSVPRNLAFSGDVRLHNEDMPSLFDDKVGTNGVHPLSPDCVVKIPQEFSLSGLEVQGDQSMVNNDATPSNTDNIRKIRELQEQISTLVSQANVRDETHAREIRERDETHAREIQQKDELIASMNETGVGRI